MLRKAYIPVKYRREVAQSWQLTHTPDEILDGVGQRHPPEAAKKQDGGAVNRAQNHDVQRCERAVVQEGRESRPLPRLRAW